ncbi:hypothetical protein DEJ25_13590 [Curtobacterium sp. MCPF17_011]|uniref:hypothetical protein n=1 Tax=Curtobacterium sp. MCPF17_011 TaxID=2175652 RepID=UPI000DA8EE58|nr:hypothetical protein [Curtobacterium sp. MCPF17_011]PZF10002.1 hypothetical protein DEJ25_13590 [Curtobacterium sp. MCPF17_011]
MNVDGTAYPLAQGQDLHTLETSVVEADRAGADLVKVTLYGNRSLDVVVTPGVPITFEVDDVADEDRDDGDLSSPFDVPDFDSFDDHSIEV